MTSDLDLLGRFARENAQDAFAEIVRRHLDLVYSAALRQVRSPQLAEEIAQSVFADLARVAATPASPDCFTPWLYAVTRRTAIDVLRKESRRQLREQIAAEMQTMNATESGTGVPPAWAEISPLLDDAMAALDETDRAAVLLRFFENKSLREVGEQLKISDDAAQKRVSRAVEKLREFFSKRKITVGAGGLTILLSANAVQAAPVGLAATISAAVLAGTAISTSTAIATTKIIAMTTLQKTFVAVTVAALAGAGIFEARQAAQLRDQVQTFQQTQPPLAEQIQNLQSNLTDATNRLANLLAENARLKSNPHEMELLKLRGETGMLREQNKIFAQALQSAEKQNHPTFPTNVVSRDSWRFAGYATPEDSLQSTIWAKSVGNEQVWRNGAAPEATNSFNSEIQGVPDEERSQSLIAGMKYLTGYQVLSEMPVGNSEVLVQLEAHGQANGTSVSAVSIEVMKQIDGEWKLYDQYTDADQLAETLKSLISSEANPAQANSTNTNLTNTVRIIGQ